MGIAARSRETASRPKPPARPSLKSVVWNPPPGWQPPGWYAHIGNPPPAGLPMTAERMRWCRAILGWTTSEIGWRLRLDERRVRRMIKGEKAIPDTLAIWLERHVAALLSQPVEPDDWHNSVSLLDEDER